jgi:hypothetical protein
LEKIHQLNYEHDRRVYQKKLAEWEKDHEQIQRIREQRKKEYMENEKMKNFLIERQDNPVQPELLINIEEWKDDVYENPPPKEPVASEFKTNVVRKEIEKVSTVFYRLETWQLLPPCWSTHIIIFRASQL